MHIELVMQVPDTLVDRVIFVPHEPDPDSYVFPRVGVRAIGPLSVNPLTAVLNSLEWTDVQETARGVLERTGGGVEDMRFSYPEAHSLQQPRHEGVVVYVAAREIYISELSFERVMARWAHALVENAERSGSPAMRESWWPTFVDVAGQIARRAAAGLATPMFASADMVVPAAEVDGVTLRPTTIDDFGSMPITVESSPAVEPLALALRTLDWPYILLIARVVRDRTGGHFRTSGVFYPADTLDPRDPTTDAVVVDGGGKEIYVGMAAFERVMARYFRALVEVAAQDCDDDWVPREPWWPEFVAITEELERRVAGASPASHAL